MSVLVLLFFEFFKIGLFAVGGGLATIPFLYELAEKYDWFNAEIIPDMIAISESTPGPIGVNMATYAGFNAYGVWGGVIATAALTLPSLIIATIVARLLHRFRESKLVDSIFGGLRPAVTGLIAAACWQTFSISVLRLDRFAAEGLLAIFSWKAMLLFAVLYALIIKFNKHPVVYIAFAAVVGMAFSF